MCWEIFRLFAKWVPFLPCVNAEMCPRRGCVVCASVCADPLKDGHGPAGWAHPIAETVASICVLLAAWAQSLLFLSVLQLISPLLFYAFLICLCFLWAAAFLLPSHHLENCALPKEDPSDSSLEIVWLLLPSHPAWVGDCSKLPNRS